MTLFELLPSLRHGLNPHLDRAIWPLSAYVDDLGRLCVGDVAADDIAAEFGTPTYVVDEEDFRARIRCYRAALPDAELIYAGKALLSIDVARWAADEGAGVNVCSAGELATALAADVPPSRIVLDGVITAAELYDAVAAGVGRIVVDSPSEISLLACRVRHRQRVLVGVIPDVGAIDQKFGFALSGGQAAGALRRVLDQPWLDLVGLHCRLGSQLTDASLYGEAIRQMIGVMAEVRDRHQIVLTELNLGGGHAVPYLSGDPELNLRSLGSTIDAALESACAEHEFPRPQIVIEPGRAIAARAGMTLCRVIAVKRQPGGHTFVAVDGGSGDIPAGAPRREIHGGTGQSAPADRDRTRHRRGPAWQRRRDRPRRRAARGHPPRRSAGGGLHRRLSALDGCRATAWWAARRWSRSPGAGLVNWCAGKPWPTCWPEIAAGTANDGVQHRRSGARRPTAGHGGVHRHTARGLRHADGAGCAHPRRGRQ